MANLRSHFWGPVLGASFLGPVSGSTQFLWQISGVTSEDQFWGQVSGDQCVVVLNSCGQFLGVTSGDQFWGHVSGDQCVVVLNYCGKFQGSLLGSSFWGKFLGNSVCVARAWSKFRGK